jgi:hypothetical protein
MLPRIYDWHSAEYMGLRLVELTQLLLCSEGLIWIFSAYRFDTSLVAQYLLLWLLVIAPCLKESGNP